MNDEELKEFIKQYLKDNLYVGIETTREDCFESASVCVKVYLEGELISQDRSSL